jgi:5-methyltetrahydropteroyltriglutamate--homocysteine methyltransferase
MLTTSVVGSYTRPPWLISAMESARYGKASDTGSLQELIEQAKLLTIKEQEDAGIDVITDGEQGRSNFYRYLVEAASGLKQLANFPPENPSAIDKVEYRDARNVANPLITGELKWNGEPVTARDARFAKKHSSKRVKMTIASPSLILRRMWRPSETYRDYDSAREGVTRFTKEEVDNLVSADVDFIQFDSPELTTYADDSIPGDVAKEEMRKAVDVINSVLPTTSSKVKTGVHVCWGNYRGTHRSDGFLSKIYPELLNLKVDQLVLELASARHEDDIEVFKEYPSERLEIGAGVIDVKTPDVEPVRIVKKRIQRLLNYIDEDKLWLNGDCGFASRFDTTLIPRSSCFQKLNSMSIATREFSSS